MNAVLDVAFKLAMRFNCHPDNFLNEEVELLLADAKRVARLSKQP